MDNLLKINKIQNNTVHKSAIIREMHNIEIAANIFPWTKNLIASF